MEFYNFQIKVYNTDLSESTSITEFEGHKSYINSIAFDPDGNLLASASDDLTCRIWNTKFSSENNKLDFKIDLKSPGNLKLEDR
jgi:nuclear pore complex protein Nup37